jgi:hypothetical protein
MRVAIKHPGWIVDADLRQGVLPDLIEFSIRPVSEVQACGKHRSELIANGNYLIQRAEWVLYDIPNFRTEDCAPLLRRAGQEVDSAMSRTELSSPRLNPARRPNEPKK